VAEQELGQARHRLPPGIAGRRSPDRRPRRRDGSSAAERLGGCTSRAGGRGRLRRRA
jgi:hypothetical protein